MNILTDRLPETVTVGSSEFEIETDFRAAVAFELLVEQGETNVFALLRPFFPNGIPRDLYGAMEAALSFYRCGEKPAEEKGKGKRAYSFRVDGATIYADFWRYYGLDLSGVSLHWYAFRTLLAGLPDDSGYKQRVYYRTCELSGLPKKERERINKIRKAIEISGESKITLEERNAKMLAYATQRSKEANSL